MTMIKRKKNVLVDDDKSNVVEWIQGKAKLKEGLAFPPDFLKREITYNPEPPKEMTKSEIMEKAAKAHGVPIKKGKLVKVDLKDLKGNIKINEGPVIRVLECKTAKYPHRPGTQGETKSNAFRDGMTVAEYRSNDLGIKGYWHTAHLRWCVREGVIRIEE